MITYTNRIYTKILDRNWFFCAPICHVIGARLRGCPITGIQFELSANISFTFQATPNGYIENAVEESNSGAARTNPDSEGWRI